MYTLKLVVLAGCVPGNKMLCVYGGRVVKSSSLREVIYNLANKKTAVICEIDDRLIFLVY